ncbi:bifunctional DNA primase/polymerase [Streptomyces luteogriseus]|uniref:bifunctional DNA primase/polymerase n=1 Tax=Streptomyces luteogriseus TaxID=68233 RepID=UPI00379635E0
MQELGLPFGAALPGPDEMPDGPYGLAAQAYWDAGWQPLPLPPGKKFPPPKGFTGQTAHGQTLTAEQVGEWSKSRSHSNVALRMSHRSVALDVDAYTKGRTVKAGAQSLESLIAEYGPLPPTPSSSAREGLGGQIFYRLPESEILIFPGDMGPGIEMIQRHHRYSVVWPSENPDADGAMYRWWLPDPEYLGEDWWKHRIPAPDGYIPRADEIPELPEGWWHARPLGRPEIGAYTGGGGAVGMASQYDAIAFLNRAGDQEARDPWLGGRIIDRYISDVRSGRARHDSMVSALVWCAKAAWGGLIDGEIVHDTIQSEFASDTADRHTPGEFENAWRWAVAQADAGDGAAYLAQWEARRDAYEESRSATGSVPQQREESEPAHDRADVDQAVGASDQAGVRVQTERTWQPQDLEDVLSGTYQAPRPTVGHRDDGIGLFYPRRVSTVVCETEGGKTWLACATAIQEMNRGRHVVYLDFEDERAGVVSRLLTLGAAPDVIRTYFRYVRPENMPSQIDALDLAQSLEIAPSLVVVDGVTEAMALFDLDPLSNKDAATFGRVLLRPLKASGAAVVTLDHVVKSAENRGRYSLGAVHKLNGLDGVQYMMENIKPIGIGLTGRTRVRIAKDRPGQIRRHGLSDKNGMFWIMDMVVTSHDESFAEANLYPPNHQLGDMATSVEPGAEEKAEAEIAGREVKVLAVLRQTKDPLSGKAVEDLVEGRASVTRRALTRLVHAGKVVTTPGPRGATLHSLPDAAT